MKKKRCLVWMIVFTLILTSANWPTVNKAAAATVSTKTATKTTTTKKKKTVICAVKNAPYGTVVVKKGHKFKLKVTSTKYKKFKYTVSNKKIATITKKGVIKGKKKGSCKVTIKSGKKTIKTLKVYTGTPVTKVTVKSKTQKLYVGGSAKIKATVKAKKATYKKLKYISSSSKIATVTPNGKIVAKKEGVATITVTSADGSNKTQKISLSVYPDNKYEDIKQKVAVADTEELSDNLEVQDMETADTETLGVSISGYVRKSSTGYSIFVDQRDEESVDEVMTNVESVTASYYTSYGSAATSTAIDVNWKENKWYVDNIPADIGTTNVIVTARLTTGDIVTRTVAITRVNNTITYKDNVFCLDASSTESYFGMTSAELIQQFYDSIVDIQNDDKGNDDPTDDESYVTVKEDSWFVKQLKDPTCAEIAVNSYFCINSCDQFLSGFSYQVLSSQEADNFIKYPSNEYEVIRFGHAEYWDMLDENTEVCLDQSSTIDEQNPISFMYTAYGFDTEEADTSQISTGSGISTGTAITNLQYKQMGKSAVKKGITINNGVLTVDKTIKDAVIYDADGDENTTDDQIKFNLTAALKDVQLESCVEWHPIKDRELLPEQILLRLSYIESLKAAITSQFKVEGSIGALVNDALDIEDQKKIFGYTITGIDDDDIVLAYMGVNLATMTAQDSGFGNIGYHNIEGPSVVFAFVANASGNITIKSSLDAEYKAYHKKGINIQKDGFEGKYGTVQDNAVDADKSEYNSFTDRYVQSYNLTCKSQYDKTAKPVVKFSLNTDASGELKLTFGAAASLRAFDLTPVKLKGEFYLTLSGTLAGDISYDTKFTTNINAEYSLSFGIEGSAYAKLQCKDRDGDTRTIEGTVEGVWEINCIASASTQNITVKVYEYDGDTDTDNDVPITGATVSAKSMYSSDATEFTLVDSNNGDYVNGTDDHVFKGYWNVTVEKAGYATHVEKRVEVTMKDVTMKVYLNKESNSTVSGSVKEYNSSKTNTSSSNGARVVLMSTTGHVEDQTVTTSSSGSYKFTNVPVGTYDLKVYKTNFVTAVVNDIKITTTSQNYSASQVKLSPSDAVCEVIQGKILSSKTGKGVAGVTVNLVPTYDADFSDSDILFTTVSDSDGSYKFENLVSGYYTVSVPQTDKYFGNTVFAESKPSTTTLVDNCTITPIMSPNQFEMKLTWGATPSDLDLHLCTNLEDSSKNYHVYYYDKTSDGSVDSSRANLDVDDTSSYGPETITVVEAENGIYTCYIHNYSNRSSSSSTALADSGACVKLSTGTGVTKTYNVPNEAGTLWKVFSYNTVTKEIIEYNTMSYESSPSAVGKEVTATATPDVE